MGEPVVYFMPYHLSLELSWSYKFFRFFWASAKLELEANSSRQNFDPVRYISGSKHIYCWLNFFTALWLSASITTEYLIDFYNCFAIFQDNQGISQCSENNASMGKHQIGENVSRKDKINFLVRTVSILVVLQCWVFTFPLNERDMLNLVFLCHLLTPSFDL